MGASKNKHAQYYAVVRGRVDEPTIFSSWGDAHPRVTYYSYNLIKGFPTLNEACEYMKAEGVDQYKQVIKQTALNTRPGNLREGYFAVANGANPGSYPGWYGLDGAFKETKLWPGACHQYFRTQAQAEAFIQDWNDSLADVCRMAALDSLDSGPKRRDIKAEDLAKRLRFSDEHMHACGFVSL